MKSNVIIQQEESRGTYLIYGIVFCWGILAIIFGLLDLQISLYLVNTQSDWARWITEYGEWPGYIMIISSLLILGVIFLQKLQKNVESFYFQHLKEFAVITVGLAILNPILLVTSIRLLWGRVRFRDLAPDYSNYTPFYLPQGINGHVSFPSGHVAMGWMLLPLLLLTRDKNWKIKLIVGIGISVWGVLVALGRIVIGAHYASDVLFSTGMALVCYLLLYRRFLLQLAPMEEIC